MPVADKEEFIRKMKNPRVDALGKSNIFKKIVDVCKHISICPLCHAPNGK
jgi:DNA-directed RNA polymerase III subunit RPC1